MDTTRPCWAALIAALACSEKGERDTQVRLTEDSGICAETWFRDADGDGYGDRASPELSCAPSEGLVRDATDCDDADASVHPGAGERCGGGDEDCDGRIDDADSDVLDAGLWYADADGDGAGAAAVSVTACDVPDGYTDNAEDCDDAVYVPGGVPAWYTDADGDGWGAEEEGLRACEGPEGAADQTGDCDEADASVHPEAEERCDDGLDTDCDGEDADDDAVDAATFYPDVDGDGWGGDSGARTACAAPDAWLDAGGDCDDADPGTNPDQAEICDDGVDQDCDGTGAGCGVSGELGLTDADITLTGESGGWLGHAVAGGADVDGDGYDELIVGDPLEMAAYVLHGPLSAGTLAASAAETVWASSTRGVLAGRSAAWVGDVDGDGEVELALGAHDGDLGARAGQLFLAPGEASGERSLQDEALSWLGGAGSETADALVSAGDTDGDGTDDLLIGSPGAESDGGQVFLLRGPVDSSGALVDADLVVSGELEARVGCGVAGVGDWDGDGLADLVFGASGIDDGEDEGGAVYALSGTSSGTSALSSTLSLGVALGGAYGDEIGCALASPGDVDGDGLGDLIIAGEGSGTAYELRGPLSGTLDLDYADARWAAASGPTAAAGAGDLDGDGWPERAVGDSNYYGDRGQVLLIGGPLAEGAHDDTDLRARIRAPSGSDGIGWAVAGAGDLDGDGLGELLVGAYDANEAWIFLGGGM